MIKKVDSSFDEETRTTYCYITDDKGRISIGEAICHEEDIDVMSWRTGEEIAFRRAKIHCLQTIRACDIKPALAALKHLYSCINRSAKFNPNSYENSMLQRQIRQLEFDLATNKEMVAYERKNLKAYIDGKEKIYQRIRKAKSEQ